MNLDLRNCDLRKNLEFKKDCSNNILVRQFRPFQLYSIDRKEKK